MFKQITDKMTIIRRVVIASIILLGLAASPIASAAPSSTNKINIYIPYVYLKDLSIRDEVTNNGTNSYTYNNRPLTNEDEIRYGWEGADLSLDYKTRPAEQGSYLRIYLNDDSNDTNLITEHGSSPLPISALKSRLKEGSNTILIVLISSIDNTPATPSTKLEMTFDYRPDTPSATTQVVSPSPGVIANKGSNYEFNVQIRNQAEGQKQLAVFNQDTKADNLLFVVDEFVDRGDYQEAKFTSEEQSIFLEKVKDSKNAKLVFALLDADGNAVESSKTEYNYISNYQGTIQNTSPRLTVLEPQDGTEVTLDYQFQLEVSNFELISKKDGDSNPNQGYVQIRINGDLVEQNTNKTSFTLRELGEGQEPGEIKIETYLVNQEFEKIGEAASSSLNLKLIESEETVVGQENTASQNSYWRIAIILTTVILILGSISILITRS